MKETERYVGPDGEALHPGDRIGLEPPGCLKRDDGLDAWLTARRHELARACELPEKVMHGDDLPDDLPPDGGGLGPWHWLGLDALKIKNPEVMILGKESSLRPCGATSPAAAEEAGTGKDGGKMERNVKGIGEAALLAALFNAAKPDRQDVMYSRHESMTKEEASALLDKLSGYNANTPVRIDKLYGRYILMTFWPGMTKIDGTGYDTQNGWGKTATVVESLRREITAKKNAERKAERAKRHRLAAYWMDGESHAQFVCSGGNAGEYVRVGAQLLASVIRKLPEKMRANAVSDAMTIVLQETKENGEADD